MLLSEACYCIFRQCGEDGHISINCPKKTDSRKARSDGGGMYLQLNIGYYGVSKSLMKVIVLCTSCNFIVGSCLKAAVMYIIKFRGTLLYN